MELSLIGSQVRTLADEYFQLAPLKAGQILVVGGSTSAVEAYEIGTHSSRETGALIYAVLAEECAKRNIYLAVQCCEHLNRALIMEAAAAGVYGYEPVSVVPVPKAGGSLAAAAYRKMEQPVAVEAIKAHGGIDIGCTMIGMHLKEVAVPLRMKQKNIGAARVVCAKTRPKYIGGERANYQKEKTWD